MLPDWGYAAIGAASVAVAVVFVISLGRRNLQQIVDAELGTDDTRSRPHEGDLW